MNLPSIQFKYIFLYKYLYSPSFKFAIGPEGKKGEYKLDAKFFLYTVCVQKAYYQTPAVYWTLLDLHTLERTQLVKNNLQEISLG